MKKSTILLLVVVYIIAFFIVGLLGMQIRSHYQVSYINEILITPWEENHLVKDEEKCTVEKFGDEETDPAHVRIVHDDTYKTIKYTEGLVLKFNVQLLPENTSISDYKLSWKDDTTLYHIEKNEVDKTIFVENIKKPGTLGINVWFTLEDNHMNGVKSTVHITIKK